MALRFTTSKVLNWDLNLGRLSPIACALNFYPTFWAEKPEGWDGKRHPEPSKQNEQYM